MFLLFSNSKILTTAKSHVTRHNIATHPLPPPELPADLAAARLVLVRRKGLVLSLSPPCKGPGQDSILHFTIKMGDREEVVTIS